MEIYHLDSLNGIQTIPEKYINDPEAWEKTQNIMREILNHLE